MLSNQKIHDQGGQPEPGKFDQYKNGPILPSQRECRDVLCCILMTFNIIAMVILAIYSYTYGNTHNIYRATDDKQNICGKSDTVTADYPYAYFYNPTIGDLSKRYCVKECPKLDGAGGITAMTCYNSGNACPAYTITVKQDGTYTPSGATPDSNSIIGYDSTSVIGRVCIPGAKVLEKAFESVSTKISDGLRQAGLGNFITDLQTNWRWLLLSLVLAVLLSVFFMFSLRCFAGCIVWTSIVGLIFLMAALGILFCLNGGAISRNGHVGNLGVEIPNLPPNDYYNIFGYICFGLAGLFFILTLCCYSRIRLAVAICGVSGQFVAEVCQTVLVPMFMGLIVFALWVASFLGMLGLIGGAKFVAKGDVFTKIDDYTDNYLAMFYYFVFGTLWLNAMLQAITIFVIASVCALWYFTRGGPGSSSQKIDSPVCTSYWMAFRFHFGSLAFGSMILALVQFIQFIIEIFNKQVQASGTSNQCTECAINFLRCFMECLQRIIQCLNRNAYIQIAVTGKSFCSASYDAFSLIASNPLRYGITLGIGQLLMVLGKLIISGLTTFLFYLLITMVADIKANVQEPIYLLILVFIASYAIATVYMSVYSIAIQTILACFIIDETSNKTAVHAPPELRQLMDK